MPELVILGIILKFYLPQRQREMRREREKVEAVEITKLGNKVHLRTVS